ncbi:MAG: hypothetical protein MUD14_21400 [Hydrococcus sp. Prado102]|jgi:hypothetical protein|nr:hypothetical protein [Hydrococcus sp. Prado102]
MNKLTVFTSIFGLLGAASLAVSTPAEAAILNGDFENSLTNWTTVGDVNVQTTGGNSQALLTTAATSDGDNLNVSGKEPNYVGFDGGLEEYLGLSLGSLDPDANNFIAAIEGSAIQQTFTAQAGDSLTLDWNFLTDDTQDYAFIALAKSNQLSTLSYNNLTTLSNSNGLIASNNGFQSETGVRQYSYTFASAGTYILSLGVVDVTDVASSSGLLVDNVKLTPKNTDGQKVPEPNFILGLVLLGAFGLSSRQKKINSL